jgi:hypothetical protein
MADPLKDIEDKRAQLDIGILAARIYSGAKEEGAADYQAFLVTAAFFIGMFHPKPPTDEEGGDEESPEKH